MSEAMLSKGLDYYKATMSQVEFEKIPDEIVTFELKNRGENLLSEFCSPDELRARIDELRHGWQADEVAYLAGLNNQVRGNAQFSEAYLDYLMDNELPPVSVGLDDRGDLAVSTTGAAPLVTFWETVIMSEINEIYFHNKLATQDASIEDIYSEGEKRLNEKIAILKTRPDIKFSDFGTRRRFSYEWQKHVVTKIATELPENFVGTSNIYLAHELGCRPIGTFAHELPMIYASLAEANGESPLSGHHTVLDDWYDTYDGDLSTALTDTFGSEFFFTDFTPQQARSWKSLRHDSGDPFDFGNAVVEFYTNSGIDPNEKTIVFSDGLDIAIIIKLADYFKGKINVLFGWGTTLTNDVGQPANNFVMKATDVNGIATVKLSDSIGKHTGPEKSIERYINERDRAIAMGAAAWQACSRKSLQKVA